MFKNRTIKLCKGESWELRGLKALNYRELGLKWSVFFMKNLLDMSAISFSSVTVLFWFSDFVHDFWKLNNWPLSLILCCDIEWVYTTIAKNMQWSSKILYFFKVQTKRGSVINADGQIAMTRSSKSSVMLPLGKQAITYDEQKSHRDSILHFSFIACFYTTNWQLKQIAAINWMWIW